MMTAGLRGVFGQGGDVRVGLYARVSTHDQQTLPLQLTAMREYFARPEWSVVQQVEEIGSGASSVRPQPPALTTRPMACRRYR